MGARERDSIPCGFWMEPPALAKTRVRRSRRGTNDKSIQTDALFFTNSFSVAEANQRGAILGRDPEILWRLHVASWVGPQSSTTFVTPHTKKADGLFPRTHRRGTRQQLLRARLNVGHPPTGELCTALRNGRYRCGVVRRVEREFRGPECKARPMPRARLVSGVT